MTRPRPFPAGVAAGPWFDDRFRLGDATASLYCFPFAGGTSAFYSSWAGAFTDGVELVPVQLPARGVRMAEPPATDLGSMAAEVAARIAASATRPLLFGHSMGAITAFEVARRLRELGRPAGHLFVSGRPAPPIPLPRTVVSDLPRAAFLRVLRDYGAISEEILGHAELLDVVLPMIRSDFSLIERYEYVPGPPLDCPILGWCGDDDPDGSAEDMRGWGEMTTGGFTLVERPGGHFFLTEHRDEIIRAIRWAARG
ncbi:alpha/beta fold hydrolase [Saccharothrix sp. BKS2]|uniref:thioesterase II family protein n=1 Tax=Saccharothrix sp. BKS2 TaxID=3064400 RepID=UPI0039E88897